KDANEESETLKTSILEAKNADGTPTWTPLTALTLMVFFVLAMQCMSTVAIVRRETNSWAWALFMVGYMTGLFFFAVFVTNKGEKLLGYKNPNFKTRKKKFFLTAIPVPAITNHKLL